MSSNMCHQVDDSVVSINKRDGKSLFLGIGAAMLACICCTLPMLLIAGGLGSIQLIEGMKKYELFFNTLSGLTLVGGVLYLEKKHKLSGVAWWRNKVFIVHAFVMVLSFTLMLWLMQEFVIPQILATHVNSQHHHRIF